jgi:hypothetical protein
VVECDLAKVEVAGSNPVSRSIRFETPSEEGFVFSVRNAKPLRTWAIVEDSSAPSSFQSHFRPMDIFGQDGYLKEQGAVPKW